MDDDVHHPLTASRTVRTERSRSLTARTRWRRVGGLGVALALAFAFAFGTTLAQPPTTLRIGILGPVENLDPRANLRTSEAQAISGVYEPLLRITPEYGLEPTLATRWMLAEDGRSLTLELRADVRFHDGSPFDADDVRSTLTNALQDSAIVDIETPDARTVVLRFREPSARMLYTLARIPMLASEAGLDPGLLPAGTGPYAIVDATARAPLTLRRNDGYWDAHGAFERVEFHAFTDPAALVEAFARGRLDATQARLPTADAERLSRVRGVTVDVVAGGAVEQVVANTRSAPLDDPRVRGALAHLMPRERIVELATGRLLVAQSAPLGRTALWWDPALERPFEPPRATELLTEAGATFERPLSLITNATAERTLIAEQLEATFGRHGVRVNSEILEFRDLLERARTGQFDLLVLGLDHGGDPIGSMLNTVHGFLTSPPAFSDARVRELADAVARLDPTTEAGSAALDELLTVLVDEAATLYLVATAEVAAVRVDFGEARAHPVAAHAFQGLLRNRAP